MLAGLTVSLFYVFAHKGIFFIIMDYLDLVGGERFLHDHAEAFGTVGAIVNLRWPTR
jgi:cation/acetate symporter